MRTPTLSLVALLLTLAAAPAHAFTFEPHADAPQTRVGAAAFDAEVQGRYVAATLTVDVTGPRRADGRLRFALPPGAVLHQAAIWVPGDERWAIGETLGRRAGQQAFDNTDAQPDRTPLLVQKIGRDLYRAQMRSLDDTHPLRIRLRYAHLIEPTESGWALRIALADPDLDPVPSPTPDPDPTNPDPTNPDPTPPDPINLEVRVRVHDGWTPLGWRSPRPPIDPQLQALDGSTRSTLRFNHLDFAEDIWLDLDPTAPVPEAGGLRYEPAALAPDQPAPVLPEAIRRRLTAHTHLHWRPDLAALPRHPRRVVFVIDHSGSMLGPKMAQTLRGVRRCLDALEDGDLFGLVAFNHQATVFRDTLSDTTHRADAYAWLARLTAHGSTDLHRGLTTAAGLTLGPVDLFLLTDALTNTGLTDPEAMLESLGAHIRDLRVHGFGIGHDLAQAPLMQLVERSGGDAAFALDDAEITGDLLALFDRARRGGVEAATLTVDDRPTREIRRVLVGDELYEGIIDSHPTTLRLTGTAGDPIERSVALDEIALTTLSHLAPPLVGAAWTARIEAEIDRDGETPARVAAAVELARIYGIVTRYSSLIALPDEADYAARGVPRVPRDPAGIALAALAPSPVDEDRVGGAGTDDGWPDISSDSDPDADTTEAVACHATPAAPGSGARWPLLLLIAAIAPRIRRRR